MGEPKDRGERLQSHARDEIYISPVLTWLIIGALVLLCGFAVVGGLGLSR